MQVFDELQVYYRNELNMHDFSQRLGNLMTIAHGTAVRIPQEQETLLEVETNLAVKNVLSSRKLAI